MIAEDTMNTNERYNVGNNMSLCIQSANLEEIQRFYNNLISDKHVKIISARKIYLVKHMVLLKILMAYISINV